TRRSSDLLSVRQCLSSLRFWLQSELHNLCCPERPPREEENQAQREHACSGGRHEHGQARRHGGRANVCPRPGEFRDATHQGTESLRESFTATGRDKNGQPGNHPGVPCFLRCEHEVHRRARGIRNHGGHFFTERRSTKSPSRSSRVK